MTNKSVLVTGACGFIGRHVARFYARQGWRVAGMGYGSFSEQEQQEWGIAEWHPCGITIETLKKYAGKPDVIIHCAGGSSVGFSLEYPFNDYQRTVNTTLHVLEFVRLYAPDARVVNPSSAAVYGLIEKMPIYEDSPLNPVSTYGVHKKIAEELIQSYARHFGVATAIVRLFSVYGVGLRKQLLWDTCKKVSINEITFWGSGKETRDWLHVEDAAELLYMAGTQASDMCPVVNGGFGSGVTVQEVLQEVFTCFNRTDIPIFSGMCRPGDPQHYMADITTAKGWGWTPGICWRDGVREFVEWFKKDMS